MSIEPSRQLLINGMNEEKQEKLRTSRIIVIGAGGLATTALSYLVMAGVEYVTIVDFDHIEASNLHRQTLYTPNDIDKNKAEVAREYLLARAPAATIHAITEKLNDEVLLAQILEHDIVLDCTDKRAVSYQINDCAIKAHKPVVFANASEMSGQLFVMLPNKENYPTFRTLWDETSEQNSGELLGVIGPIPGVMGSLQALEAIKVLTRFTVTNEAKLFHVDFVTLSIQKIALTACSIN